MIVRDGKNGSYIRVRRNDYLIAILHNPHFLVASKNQSQGIQAIGYSYTM